MNKDVRARWIEELESGEYPDREMTFLSQMYRCQQKPSDNIHVMQNSTNTDVHFTAYDGKDVAEVDLARDDALSLAWDIIEHFEDGTRPTPAIKVGDYVKSDLGIPGKVISINDAMLNAKALHGIFSWHVSDCTLATKQEFVDYYQQKIADIANGQD